MSFLGQTLKSGDCQDPSRKPSQLAALLTTNPLPTSPRVRKTHTEMLEQLWMHRSSPATASPSQLPVTCTAGQRDCHTCSSPGAVAQLQSSPRPPHGRVQEPPGEMPCTCECSYPCSALSFWLGMNTVLLNTCYVCSQGLRAKLRLPGCAFSFLLP